MSTHLSHGQISAGSMVFLLSAPVMIPMSMFAGGLLAFGDTEQLSILMEKFLLFGSAIILALAVFLQHNLNRFSYLIVLGAVVCLVGFTPAVVEMWVGLFRLDMQLAVPLLRIVCICFWLLYVINVDWSSRTLWMALLLAGLVVNGANMLFWIQQGRPIPFSGLTPQKNVLATVGFCGAFVGTLGTMQNRNRLVLYLGSIGLIVMSMVVLYASGGRKSLLGMIVAVGIYWGWQFIRHNAWLTTSVFLASCVGSYVIVPIYLNLESMPFFWVLDGFLVSSQNQDIYTGREIVWPDAMTQISERPWFGYGQDYRCSIGRLADRLERGLSAHNQSLAILYQSGITGLLGALFFLWIVWWCLCRVAHHRDARLSAAFMIGIIISQYFTASLLQNLFVGLGLWTIIGSGIAHNMRNSNSQVHLDSTDSDSEFEPDVFHGAELIEGRHLLAES